VEREDKKPKEHWFCKHAKTIPVQYLPEAAVMAIGAVLRAKEGDKDKLGDIEQIVAVYEELLI